jgi:germacradienol/geosmin synthase
MGLVGDIWTLEQLRGFDFAYCAAMIYPDADPAALDLSTDWLTWGTYADDLYPLRYARTGDVAGARAQNARLTLLLSGTPVPPPNALEWSLADLWRRTPSVERERYRLGVAQMFEGWLWEVVNQAQHRIPDPVDYVEMRRATFGCVLTAGLGDVPDTRVLRQLTQAAHDYGGLVNDLFSYQKEIQYEDELHNMVFVVEHFLGCDRDTARDIVADLATERMRQFQHIVETELPTDPAVVAYAGGLEDWMAGIVEWHRSCVRYGAAALWARYASRRDSIMHIMST